MRGSAGVLAGVGIVVIGRNEGERLQRCLRSLGKSVRDAFYVDSGSTDDSVAFARSLGVTVVELDTSIPFTAARARNAGFEAMDGARQVTWVQFVDGDCEVEPEWLRRAVAELERAPDVAAVFGRRRERAPEASVYNRLCDLEWDVPIGDVLACGGDVMMRACTFREVGGYAARLIAGEEPELCHRLRESGHRIRRVDAPMTVHDADMHRFGQWWRRAVRAGYVEAEGIADLGRRYERRRSAISNLVWAVALPVASLTAIAWSWWHGHAAVAVATLVGAILLYAVQWLRIFRHGRRRWLPRDAALHATFCVLGKWPAVVGMWTYGWRRLRSQGSRLIEYKRAAASVQSHRVEP